ncbi:hypothetical protein HPB47_025979 [Ixodes persulcatus]|uniref:Uncharacterized protein n=1 Tax=Ixodes persulcatus TaxID=34615 RepID=A0AC60Q0H1_IXOPE|nr:hypothetical protein HPB47_025979 [Ixodes persulcatus]
MDLTEASIKQLNEIVRKAFKIALGIPVSTFTEAMEQLGIYNSFEEMRSAQKQSQVLRLSRTETGPRTLQRIKEWEQHVLTSRNAISQEWKDSARVPPLPKNMDTEGNKDRKEARAKALNKLHGNLEHVYHVDAGPCPGTWNKIWPDVFSDKCEECGGVEGGWAHMYWMCPSNPIPVTLQSRLDDQDEDLPWCVLLATEDYETQLGPARPVVSMGTQTSPDDLHLPSRSPSKPPGVVPGAPPPNRKVNAALPASTPEQGTTSPAQPVASTSRGRGVPPHTSAPQRKPGEVPRQSTSKGQLPVAADEPMDEGGPRSEEEALLSRSESTSSASDSALRSRSREGMQQQQAGSFNVST